MIRQEERQAAQEIVSPDFSQEELDLLAQFRPEPINIYKTVQGTGERCRFVRPKSDDKIVQWTKAEYKKKQEGILIILKR